MISKSRKLCISHKLETNSMLLAALIKLVGISNQHIQVESLESENVHHIYQPKEAFPVLQQRTFAPTSCPNSAVYNSIIRAYTRAGQHHTAIQFYRKMFSIQTHFIPDRYTFTFVLKSCAYSGDAKTGALVHKEVFHRGLEQDTFIRTALIDMYAKLDRLENARALFDGMHNKDVVTWNVMIAGFAKSGESVNALLFFKRMQLVGVKPNSVSVLNMLPAVCELSDILLCRTVHGWTLRMGLLCSVSNGLMDAYSKCKDIVLARRLFDEMTDNIDAVSCGTMISGYVFNGCYEEALDMFDDFKMVDDKMNIVSIISAIIAATELEDLKRGMLVHDHAKLAKLDSDIQVLTALVTMYAKCDKIDIAKQSFHRIQEKDMISWSAIISALTQSGHYKDSLTFFFKMQRSGIKPDVVTVVSVLPACANFLDLKLGKSLHCYVLKSSNQLDQAIQTALVAMYAKCGCFFSANMLFDSLLNKDIVTWNALVNGYAQFGDARNALYMFRGLCLTGTRPDAGTMVGILCACAHINSINHGMLIHGLITKSGFEYDLHVKNAAIGMYAKCGRCELAELLFNVSGCPRDIISWNTLIAGFMYNGHAEGAFSAFRSLKTEGLKPNVVTIVSMLPAAANLAALKEGMSFHSYSIRTGYNCYLAIANSLMDMYSKCGRLDCAKDIFDQTEHKDNVSWNIMITGYAIHGMGKNAVTLFSRMQEIGMPMDTVTFVGVLSACRHGGLVEEGLKIFHTMNSKHYFEPKMEHYACMVDLYGRAGQLGEAWKLIQNMPVEPDASIWGAFLDACRTHSNVKMGKVALEHLKRLEHCNAAPYVILSGIYAQDGRWVDARKIRKTMKHEGINKIPGYSWLDIKDIHAF